jgi:hypothetical protein
MRTDFDFSPYYRATVGFDRIFELLGSVAKHVLRVSRFPARQCAAGAAFPLGNGSS